MWIYKLVSREMFEQKKDFVDKIMRDLGCEVLNIKLPYEQKTTTHCSDFEETYISKRPLYQYENRYFRIDEILFSDRPFIVLEFADTIEEVMKNLMEDMDPFPYDISETDIVKEVKYSLGIDPYPEI